jgi:transcriptional regulator with XRE-family HTH domain
MQSAIAPAFYVRGVLGGRMRNLRHQRNLTQAQLAEAIGCQQPWIAKLELGQAAAAPEQLRAICQVLGVSADLLLML